MIPQLKAVSTIRIRDRYMIVNAKFSEERTNKKRNGDKERIDAQKGCERKEKQAAHNL